MRLTERKTIYPKCDKQGNLTEVNCIEIKNKGLAEEKLCQLEDIEDELGIDLITLFKALKTGFYGTMYGVSKEDANANNWEPMFYELKNIDIKKYNGKLAFIYYLGDLSYSDFLVYKFEDYGKTWALTKEEFDLVKENLR